VAHRHVLRGWPTPVASGHRRRREIAGSVHGFLV
jgi:hypothetical protein